ncbi:ribosome biogenesis protein NOP53 isoform X2 [Gopherus flavomarginatus]|uniref:ribosome biogenesis protein NOP53 isoform X2 n=1 Tax=Gopherus flavomarginatus TaxID=286002 RepID=UPI0021CC0759|nr:ribosome biogenesis protein NOP53 isoform X2 [Gopherus flavomarginatus]
MAAPTGAPGGAAASGFLGLRAESRDPGAPGRRRARGGRSRKKSWKRWAGPEARLGRELGAFLEDVGLQQRAAGGLVAEKPDESLFFLDTGSEEKDQKLNRGKEKPLRIDLILQPDSKVPAPKDILAHQVPNGKTQKRKQRLWEKLAERDVVPREQRLLQARLQKAQLATAEASHGQQGAHGQGAGAELAGGFYDIWSDTNPLDRPLAGQDAWFLEQTKKRRVRRPARLETKPSELPAVEVIPAGGSYNPMFESHQALLLQAHEVEVRRQKAEEKLQRQLRFPTAAEAPTQETTFQEQCEGLLEESADEGGEEEAPDEPPAPGATPPPAPLHEKKTEQQRRREKEAKFLEARRLGEKAARCRRQELFQLRSIRLQVKRREAELLRRRRARLAKRRAEATKPRRLGRLKYEDPDLEVQLSTELAESLRTLKPEGSILRDRFKSLQKRNLIEPRERAKFKRKYRLKYVEKRAFREVTL